MKIRAVKAGIICFLGVALMFCLNPAKVEAAGKSDLMQKIQSKTGKPIKQTYFADYDGDGKKELFALVGNGSESGYAQEIWFSSSSQVKCLFCDLADAGVGDRGQGICKVNGKQKLFIAECTAHGSGSSSRCYYVKKGKAYEAKLHGLGGLAQISGRNFQIVRSEFDWCYDGVSWTGHTYKRYYIKWNGEKFTEYKAKKISLKKLKKYSGAAKVLKKIKGAGYTVTSIYHRSNGLIHINVKRKDQHETVYNNVTLKIKGKKYLLLLF